MCKNKKRSAWWSTETLEKTVVDLKSLDVHFKWKVWMCMFSIMFQHLSAHHVLLQPVCCENMAECILIITVDFWFHAMINIH